MVESHIHEIKHTIPNYIRDFTEGINIQRAVTSGNQTVP
jgi:hypothetical protein